VLGASGRTIIEAMLAGEAAADVLVGMAHKKVREGAKRDQLKATLRGAGQLRGAQRFLLRELLGQVDSLSATITRCDEAIKEALAEQEGWEQAVELLDSVPEIGRETAELLVAEVGTDMSRFPSAAHLAAWVGLAPGGQQPERGQTRSGHQDTQGQQVGA